MDTQQGNGQQAGSGRHTESDFGISRSRLGWLSVRFDGGPSYPEMVATLKEMIDRYGHCVKRGEGLSGSEWLSRIEQGGMRITECQKQAIQTLMECS
ncbi:hypothetical protein CR917_03505 [Pseudomonas sp. BRM28]|nr:hypothetical protein CR917_03505 [Pseudomonas sp. BRM28]